MSPTAQALYSIAVEENSTVSIEAIRNKAFEKLQSGEVKSIVSSSLNGKSFSVTVSKPADVLFTEATWAIRMFNGGVIKSGEVDFTGI